ncbi:MAG: hypothetical protein HYV26_16540 [Candidatus Hydrogenedentes bacterium]|nr:hypothetical protein [Candidatus Hydrogenedentota bacterium]
MSDTPYNNENSPFAEPAGRVSACDADRPVSALKEFMSSLQIPIISSLRRLDSAPRKFLFFTASNVVSWQCLVGPTLVLFARKLDMPASWVGMLISFMPLSMLLVILTLPLVTWFGPKTIMARGWLLRNLISSLAFAVPLAMYWWGPRAGWYVLGLSTLGFCVMRAIGSGDWFPWLHEVVPEDQRATFFSTETGIAQLVNVLVLLLQGLILQGDPPVWRFLIIYGIGIFAGLISIRWMMQVPGGEGAREMFSLRTSFGSYKIALKDGPFMRFITLASMGFSIVAWITASNVLYMRDALGYSSQYILVITATGSLFVLLTIGAWGRYTDHSGSGHSMSLTMIGHTCAATSLLLLWPGAPWTNWCMPLVVPTTTLFAAAFLMAAHRAMLNYVQETGRVGYTNLWIVGTSLALGVTPILAGQLIDRWHLRGFEACFMISAGAGLICAVLSAWIVRDHPQGEYPDLRLFNPVEPWRTLARIVWVTVGLHPSNRQG